MSDTRTSTGVRPEQAPSALHLGTLANPRRTRLGGPAPSQSAPLKG